MNNRELFEAWAQSRGYSLERITDNPELFWWAGEYQDLLIQLAWEKWQEGGEAAAEKIISTV